MAKKKPRSRMDHIRDVATQPMSDAPWYVRAVAYIGVPSAIAVFLVYFLTNLFTTMTTRLEAIQSHTEALGQYLKTETEQSWVTLSALQRICLNTSKTDSDRLSCVSLNRGPGK